jgi:hypothetical protein
MAFLLGWNASVLIEPLFPQIAVGSVSIAPESNTEFFLHAAFGAVTDEADNNAVLFRPGVIQPTWVG